MDSLAIKTAVFLIAFVNIIAVSVIIYKKKYNISIGLGLLVLLLISSTNMIG